MVEAGTVQVKKNIVRVGILTLVIVVAVLRSTGCGATAKCRDGSYSWSASNRGTCSSHGGVGEWYKESPAVR